MACYIARAQLASAVSNAGGMGIIETSSGQLDEIKVEIAKIRDLTDRRWGVNIAQMLTPGDTVIDFVIEHDASAARRTDRGDGAPRSSSSPDILRESWDDCRARLRSRGQAAG
ncbi:MAG: nitronate monooxygenase [Acidimicrobiaceae bacterium]|nr:nitronate monooxygenase [Acidimicrobiaceae bacterium]